MHLKNDTANLSNANLLATQSHINFKLVVKQPLPSAYLLW